MHKLKIIILKISYNCDSAVKENRVFWEVLCYTSLGARKKCVLCAQSLSCVRLFVTAWTAAHPAPLSVEFFRQEYWSELPFPPSGHLPDPGVESLSALLHWQAGTLPLSRPGSPQGKTAVVQKAQSVNSLLVKQTLKIKTKQNWNRIGNLNMFIKL